MSIKKSVGIKYVDIRFIVPKNTSVEVGSNVNGILVTEENIAEFVEFECSIISSAEKKPEVKFFVSYKEDGQKKTSYSFSIIYHARLFSSFGVNWFGMQKGPVTKNLNDPYEFYDSSINNYYISLSHDVSSANANVDEFDHMERFCGILYDSVLDTCKTYFVEDLAYIQYNDLVNDKLKSFFNNLLGPVTGKPKDELSFKIYFSKFYVTKENGAVKCKFDKPSYEKYKNLVLKCFANPIKCYYNQSPFIQEKIVSSKTVQENIDIKYLINKRFMVDPSFGINTYLLNNNRFFVSFISCKSIVTEMPVTEYLDSPRPSAVLI